MSVVGSFVQFGSIASLLDVDSPCPKVIVDTLGLIGFSFPTTLLQKAIIYLRA
jgi:xanthosine utilization system XapX-like protein